MSKKPNFGPVYCKEVCIPKYKKRCGIDTDYVTPCESCSNQEPFLFEDNLVIDYVLQRCIQCRDFNGNIDINVLFRVMELEELSNFLQIEIFDSALMINSILAEQREESLKNATAK